MRSSFRSDGIRVLPRLERCRSDFWAARDDVIDPADAGGAMRLPGGVRHYPRQCELVGIGVPALITVDPEARGCGSYRVNGRRFEQAIAPSLRGDWSAFDAKFQFVRGRTTMGVSGEGADVVYAGLEHTANPKLPNITVVPNLETRTDAGRGMLRVFGCTMGHFHSDPSPMPRVQEVYEFQSFGLLLVDRQEGTVELWVGRDGDKVAVPNHCHMTLYNIDDDDHPLITLDFADPGRNWADKDLACRIGPLLLGCYDDALVTFLVNHLHVNNPAHAAGLRPGRAVDEGDRWIRIDRNARLDLGAFLYRQLTSNAEVIGRFARLGVNIKAASPEIALDGVSYSRSLVECAGQKGAMHKHFMGAPLAPSTGASDPADNGGSVTTRLLHRGEAEWSGTGPRLLDKRRKRNEAAVFPVTILIEGAGDWVDKALIPALEPYLDGPHGRRVTVTIADDSRWHGTALSPATSVVPPRYTNIRRLVDAGKILYLDKANPLHYERYRARRDIAVVFVFTPDFTHADLARGHLDRSPTIFVEKPFDAALENVRALLEARSLALLDTEIYSIDHYRFYAWRLKEEQEGGTLLEQATDWLGGAVASAEFCLLESGPVDPHRARTLQFGLTLDLLPHGLALLGFFGGLDSIDELKILDAARYEDAPIANETFARVRFTFEDYSGSGNRVPCTATVGKALQLDRKYFQVTGVSGNGILISLGTTAPTHWWHPSRGSVEVEGGIYFVHANGSLTRKADLDTSRYRKLIADLVEGSRDAIGCAMPLRAGAIIVRSLDRIRNAIPGPDQLRTYDAGGFDPVIH
jgi:predicted dehydrogenase